MNFGKLTVIDYTLPHNWRQHSVSCFHCYADPSRSSRRLHVQAGIV